MGQSARVRTVVAALAAAAIGACRSGVTEPVPDVDPPLDPASADIPSDPTSDAGGGDAGDGASPPTITVGAPDRILLKGTIVTPDVAYDGQVLVEGSLITCVAPALGCAGAVGAAGATIIDTKGVIAPGLIDTHNHILFDIFDDSDWLPSKVYVNHNEWPNEPRYQAMLDVKQCLENASQGKPTWCPATYEGAGNLKCEMDKWGELKAMIAGTTSVVALAGTTSACFSSLARTIDALQNGLGQDKIQTSALFPPSRTAADGVCNNFATMRTDAYLIHCGEGTNAAALGELARLGTVTTNASCLYAPQTVITHGTAFTAAEFATMASAGMKLTWSPKSNVALYGTTTNIPAALDANLLVTLAPDWSMGGSQNLLDEMRFADAWDDAHFGNRLAAKDIVTMTTKNAAAALALGNRIGTLAPGHLADLMVVTKTKADPFASIVAARPKDVRVTMIGGRVLYGDKVLQPASPEAPGCEDLDVCGAPKFVCVAENTSANKLNQTLTEIKASLEAALVDLDATSPDGYAFAPLAPLVKCTP
ncbi:MAG: amidohydrolase family protein [Labilithrix sp.]|nr:amidohydrolase family protein [Labilithrix sp.]